ncbi:peptidase MA family metallohydrolase [Desulfocapsa sulfexigens]|nr:peptidase MA family metallohydrolase [Desulfocapsa sulfexigens]
MTKSTDGFQSLKQDSRIKYEDGSIKYAEEIAPYLEAAVQTIENKQGAFEKPVVIYVTKSIDSFSSYCASKYPSSCVIGDRLFASPKLLKQKNRIPGILTHELSHLQHTQDIGRWNYQTKLPVWFKEGLAVYVSNGGGAEKVTEQEAAEAIYQGKTIKPNGSGALIFRKTASSFGLKTHMFYRQSEMYVRWLHDMSPSKFRKLFTALEQGKTLDEALSSVYGFTVHQGWSQFTGEIKHNKRVNSDLQKLRSLSVTRFLPVGYALR